MKTVVFSDVHGNIQALQAMLRQAEAFGAKQFIFCGDMIGYFPFAQEVVHCLMQMPNLYAVCGNHDRYYINTEAGSAERDAFAQKYGQSYCRQLGIQELEYLKSLPQAIDLELSNSKIFIAHGSLENYTEGRIYPDTEVDGAWYQNYDIVLLGHTHYRMCRIAGNTVLLNPGSLGQPRDGNGYSYCLMDAVKKEFVFQSVWIDEKQLLEELFISGEKQEVISYLKSKMEGKI